MMRRIEANISSIEGSCGFRLVAIICIRTARWIGESTYLRQYSTRGPRGKGSAKAPTKIVCAIPAAGSQGSKQASEAGFANRTTSSSAPVGRAYAEPQVFDLIVVSFGAVLRDVETKTPRREPSDGLDHRIRRDDPVALRGDEVHAGVEQFLLRVQHVERGALPHPRLLAHARERDLGGLDLGLSGDDLRLSSLQRAPSGDDRGANLLAVDVDFDPSLPDGFLGLTDASVDFAALIDRHRQAGDRRG